MILLCDSCHWWTPRYIDHVTLGRQWWTVAEPGVVTGCVWAQSGRWHSALLADLSEQSPLPTNIQGCLRAAFYAVFVCMVAVCWLPGGDS